MTCLHTISKSPSSRLLDSCSVLLQKGDALLFMEDGIYYCDGEALSELAEIGVKIYCLHEDMIARGVDNNAKTIIQSVNYPGFVDLCCQHDKIVNWF